MCCKILACAQCTQNCLLAHGKNKDTTPVITSFFKVMYGNQFSEVLFLPPKFARTISSLIDQYTFLEDLCGQRWKIQLCKVDGSLAFQQGWNSFSVAHGLDIGDIVIFKYFEGSHFAVEMYDKTGCEKLEFCKKKRQKKRSRPCQNSTAKNARCQSVDIRPLSKQRSDVSGSDAKIIQRQSEMTDGKQIKITAKNMPNCDDGNGRAHTVSKAGYVEEPYYLINRDLGEGEDRSTLFDLSNFEMCDNKAGTDGSNKVAARVEKLPVHAVICLRSQVEAGFGDVDLRAAEMVTSVLPSDSSESEREKNKDIEEKKKLLTVSNKDSCNSKIPGNLDGENSSDMSSTVMKSCKTTDASFLRHDQMVSPSKISQSSPLEITGMPTPPDYPVAFAIQSCQSAKMDKIVKQEAVEMASKFHSYKEMIQEIHGTAGEDKKFTKKWDTLKDAGFVDMSSQIAANISSLIAVGSQSFLELSTSLPSSSSKLRAKKESKVVLLQDSEMRLWPVLYHEKPGFNILTGGWDSFSKANNIQPGDQCVFRLENEREGIYGVRIVRKRDKSASLKV
ncbi:B3 domain-containing protein [Cephalotus follicularis]|uniref:B3 domain-containing protein n=1 Tax=Cephalotus follicularis TaxID=3775 RepID=A0A1Q3B6Y6_CEPFO|nr:B3 domain-containing protein [Cephalotus follicularis]